MLVNDVSLGKVGDCLIVDSKKFVTKTFVEVHFPVILAKGNALVKDLDCRFMSSNQVERPAKLFEVVAVCRI